MRKPRDYDAELTALSDKAKLLQDRKVRQLGELVIATGADALPVEQLAGAELGSAAPRFTGKSRTAASPSRSRSPPAALAGVSPL